MASSNQEEIENQQTDCDNELRDLEEQYKETDMNTSGEDQSSQRTISDSDNATTRDGTNNVESTTENYNIVENIKSNTEQTVERQPVSENTSVENTTVVCRNNDNQRQNTSQNVFGNEEDWDLEIALSATKQPPYILKKELAKDDRVDFDKAERYFYQGVYEGVLGSKPNTHSASQLPSQDAGDEGAVGGLQNSASQLPLQDAGDEGAVGGLPSATSASQSPSQDAGDGAVGGLPSATSAIMQLPSEHGSQSLYHIKWINWKNLNTPIITQNENGPCPLIALMNVLILQRKISIPNMQQIVSASQLMEYLGDCILDHAPKVSV